jgi:fatty acid desaturase
MEFHTKKIARKSTMTRTIARVGYYVGAIFLMWYFGVLTQFFLYWVVPFMTFFFLLMYIRAVAEHFCDMDYSTIETGTRTVIPLFWERPFFSPHNVNYHIEHHIYPSVPFYRLPKLHKKLMENKSYVSQAHITYGYTTGLLRECFGSSLRIHERFEPGTPAE